MIPDDVTVVYLYNPFVGEKFRRTVTNLHDSLGRRPRRMRIIYLRPEMHHALIESGFQVVKELLPPSPDKGITFHGSDQPMTHELVIYSNVPGFHET
jgi:hypothetical protein